MVRGRDVRYSSEPLLNALAYGLIARGWKSLLVACPESAS